ncbi:protein FAR1-RELATED SEQUENCE 5-like [Tasmannia lanceolata]
MTIAGIQPHQILTSLRQGNPQLLAISRDVYNCISKIRRDILAGRTAIQALLDELADGGFHYNAKNDEEGRLTHLFFAHPKSITLSKNYSNVFVMDCTYKTNKYKMPLLDIVGVTSFNSSFYSCFAFLQKEEREDYVWALTMFNDMLDNVSRPTVIVTDRELALMGAIKIVFPGAMNLLCVWHIEKNILSKCKCHFQDEDDWHRFFSTWSTLIESPTEMAYHKAWQDFNDEFEEKGIALNYIFNTWLSFKERFIKAWTEKYLHFGNRVTSRAEGAHSNLKIYLQLSTGDFYLVKNKICLAIENQFEEIKTKLSAEKIKVPSDLRISFFDKLINRISVFALKELFKQYNLATSNPNLTTCKSHFTATMGLPCAHKMRCLLDEGKVLHLGDVHSQWRIDDRMIGDIGIVKNNQDKMKEILGDFHKEYTKWPPSQQEVALNQLSHLVGTSTPMLREPSVQNPRGRPPTSKNKKSKSSTSREPSEFEIVEATRRCSTCNGVGHNRRTCPRKDVVTMSTSQISPLIPTGVSDEIDISDLYVYRNGANSFW